MATPEEDQPRFEGIPERNSSDTLLRTLQQHHVHLSAMADTKANILITVSSVVLTLSLARFNDPGLRHSMIVLAVFTLLALLLAVLAVLPKYRPLRLPSPDAPLPPAFNLLFFGHFAELTRERFLDEIERSLKPGGSVYAAMAKDVYSLGWYLSHHKYRYLRGAYLSFLCGFLGACAVQLARWSGGWT
ncbi:hypothetical protein GCM10028794_04830 [Silanimonas algicola]